MPSFASILGELAGYARRATPDDDRLPTPRTRRVTSLASRYFAARVPAKVEPETDTRLLDSAVAAAGHHDAALGGLLPSATLAATRHRASLTEFEPAPRHGDLFEDSDDDDETAAADEVEEATTSGTAPSAPLTCAVVEQKSHIPTPIKPAPSRTQPPFGSAPPFERRALSAGTTALTPDGASAEIDVLQGAGQGTVFMDFLSSISWLQAGGGPGKRARVC